MLGAKNSKSARLTTGPTPNACHRSRGSQAGARSADGAST